MKESEKHISNLKRLLGTIPFLALGGITIYFEVSCRDEEGLGDFIYLPITVAYLFFFFLAVFLNAREYRRTKALVSYVSTGIGVFVGILILLVNFLLGLKDRTPTVLFGALPHGSPGYCIDFRENGTYKLGDAGLLGIKYHYGRYIIKDSLIVLEPDEKDSILKSRFLVVRKGLDPTQESSGYIYQLDRSGKTIQEAVYFIVVGDKISKPESGCSPRSASSDSLRIEHMDKEKKEVYGDTSVAKPVWGYRFVITGDFTGDGHIDTLKEHYINGTDYKETNKFDAGLDLEQQLQRTLRKQPASFLTCSNRKIDTLRIASGGTGQIFGIAYLKNEGDLDGDGGDEVSYVVDWADMSSVNTCHIVSYKKGKWKELYHFETRDWALPELPEVQTEYGLFGLSHREAANGADSVTQRLEKEMKVFPGLIEKSGRGKIKVKTYILGEDTTLNVNLKL